MATPIDRSDSWAKVYLEAGLQQSRAWWIGEEFAQNWLQATLPHLLPRLQKSERQLCGKRTPSPADSTLRVTTARGTGLLPVYISLDGRPVDFSQPLPAVTRALIVFHGKLRNADTYNDSG
jgi:hypothetical protein